MTDSHQNGLDCVYSGSSQQHRMDEDRQSQRKKLAAIAFGFAASVMVGFFLVGPLVKNTMGTTAGNLQGSSKFMISGAMPVSARMRPAARGQLSAPMHPIHGQWSAAPRGQWSAPMKPLHGQRYNPLTPMTMSIAVFGASGGTGAEAVLQALERGEEVTCLVRDRSKLKAPRSVAGQSEGSPFESDKLSVTQGDVTKQADVDAVFKDKGVTGVVVALGGKTKDVGATMLQDGTANIIAACKDNGVKRISVVSSIGVGDSMDQAPWTFRLLMMTVMKSIMADKNKQEELFTMADGAGAGLEFCLVRPGGLKSDPPNGVVNVITGEAGAITRGDVAAFCLDAVLEADFEYIKQAPCISSNMGSGFDSVLKDKTKSRMAQAVS